MQNTVTTKLSPVQAAVMGKIAEAKVKIINVYRAPFGSRILVDIDQSLEVNGKLMRDDTILALYRKGLIQQDSHEGAGVGGGGFSETYSLTSLGRLYLRTIA